MLNKNIINTKGRGKVDPKNNLMNKQNQISHDSSLNERNIPFPAEKDDLNNYDSDIDDPRYLPNFNLENMENPTKIDNKYNLEEDVFNIDNSLNQLKYHNNQRNFAQDNFDNVLELKNENKLLKEELYKKSNIIKEKDEIISEFQSLYTEFKNKMVKYEERNVKLENYIKTLENQLNKKNNEQLINSNSKIGLESNLMQKNSMKNNLKDLEDEYNSNLQKITEKFKQKENTLISQKDNEIEEISKKLIDLKKDNESKKLEISNYKIEINSLKSQIEIKEEEKKNSLEKKEKEAQKLKDKLSEKEIELNNIEVNYSQKISKLEEELSKEKNQNNNLMNEINNNNDRTNEYESQILNIKNDLKMLTNQLNQSDLDIRNKDMLIEQLKSQNEKLNKMVAQNEEDIKTFEENRTQENEEYNDKIEELIEEKSLLEAQNLELSKNLHLANENLKKLNDIVSKKYANMEEELIYQTNKNENLEKKYKGTLKKLKNRQDLLHRENNQLKEIINNQEMKEQEEMEMNNLNMKQNISLYKKAMGVNQIGINFENGYLNDNYYNNTDTNLSPYIDTKINGQKRALNEFKNLLNHIDDKHI